MWIPWCVNQADFEWGHKILITPAVAAPPVPIFFAIWQEGDYVRYSLNGLFAKNGLLVPGNCTVGGDRSVEIVGPDVTHADLRFF
jgi:hypothetical protein